MKQKLLNTVAVAAFALIPAFTSHADITDTSSFGTIAGNPNNGQPYAGQGSAGDIPYDRSTITTIQNSAPGGTVLPDNDVLTLAMAVTGHGAFNPTPTDNGAGTYYVNTGTSGNRSLWNYDFWISSTGGDLSNYSFLLTVAGNGESYTYNPLAIGDNGGAPGAGNSESLDFGPPFFGSINYNPAEADTYTFTLTASLAGGPVIGTDEVTAISSVPEPTTVAAGAMMLLPFGFGALRALRNRKATTVG